MAVESPPPLAATSDLRELEGPIVSLDRSAHRFRVKDRHRGTVRVKATARTRYEHLGGSGALRRGLRVEVEARRSRFPDLRSRRGQRGQLAQTP